MENKNLHAVHARFGQRIRILRKSLGFTQDLVAEKLGTTQSILSRIEKGKYPFTPEMLLAAASLFGVSADRLLTSEEVNDKSLGAFGGTEEPRKKQDTGASNQLFGPSNRFGGSSPDGITNKDTAAKTDTFADHFHELSSEIADKVVTRLRAENTGEFPLPLDLAKKLVAMDVLDILEAIKDRRIDPQQLRFNAGLPSRPETKLTKKGTTTK